MGLFGGYSKNLGSADDISGNYYTRGQTIDYLYRVSPRVSLTVNKLRFAFEAEYTAAGYGTTTKNGTVTGVDPVGNLRLLLSAIYMF